MDNNKGEKTMDTSTALKFDGFDSMFENMFNQTVEQNETVQKELTNEETEELSGKVENISSISITNALTKLNDIERELNDEFVERQELIRNMILAVVTNSNMLMLGPPGSAKTKICHSLCNHIDNSNFFEWLLNKSSDPSELLGTFSIKGMENDEFKRMTAGKLPEANIAFIDEIYKCNSPTLNALLSIMNEHIFYNNGKAVPVPLISMFAASNEPPEDDSLMAMHDRFLFRMEVEYLHDASSKKKMFNNYIHERAGINNTMSHTMISIEEVEALQQQSRSIPVPKPIINSFIALMNNLKKNANISISDRRANECIKVLQGSAVINRRQKVGLDDFNALRYVLWEKQEDVKTINAEINKIVNPFDDQYDKWYNQFADIKEKIDNTTSTKDRNQAYFQYQNSLKSLKTKVNKLITDASSNGKDTEKFCKLRDEIVSYHTNLSNEVMGSALGGASLNSTSFVDEDEATDTEYTDI